VVGYLNAIIGIPDTDKGFNEWLQWHYQDHLAIHAAVQAQYGANTPIYVLDPLDPNDLTVWLTNHQNMHNDFNGILGLQAQDLSDVDFKNKGQRTEWLFLNFEEHRAAHLALEI
jgi:hypothetical protein